MEWKVNVIKKEAGRIKTALREQGYKVEEGEPEEGAVSLRAMKKMKVVGIYIEKED